MIGLKGGSIEEHDLRSGKKETIMHSHSDGEVWGLCVIPNKGKFFTSGDDDKVFLYDITKKRCIASG